MDANQILTKILNYKGLNVKSFSEKIGMDRPQGLYDIQKGKTKRISHNMANKIISVFPEFDKYWLLTGEGEMINSTYVQEPLKYDAMNKINDESNLRDLLYSFKEIAESVKLNAVANERNSRNMEAMIEMIKEERKKREMEQNQKDNMEQAHAG